MNSNEIDELVIYELLSISASVERVIYGIYFLVWSMEG